MAFQHPDLRAVRQPDEQVHQRNGLRRAQRPAAPEHDVIDVLERDARALPDEVDGIQQVLDREHLHLPRTPLFPDDFTQSCRRGPVPSAGIDVDESDFTAFHHPPESHHNGFRKVTD